jgi:transcriptional regulator with XRE-family HTH domain
MDTLETNQFGELLRKFRRRSKLTQQALAYKIKNRSRGNIQAWEAGLSRPRERATVLALARALQLTKSEADTLLLAAHHSQEYHTQGTHVSPVKVEERLSLVDTYIREEGELPVVDITLHNKGTQTVLPKRVQVEILDVGEFRYCDGNDDDNDPTRIPLTASSTYEVILSPILKGKPLFIKIAHLLSADEADRFELKINQDQSSWLLAYVWYCLKITILYDEPARTLEVKPLLLSVPPVVDEDTVDIWGTSHTPCNEQNRATLRRMAGLEATRSASVERAIRQILGK